MSTHELTRTTKHDAEHKLAVLEAVREGNVRFSALAETLALDGRATQGLLEELRGADLVSCSPVRHHDDLVVSSLPRLREQDRTKLHRLVYN